MSEKKKAKGKVNYLYADFGDFPIITDEIRKANAVRTFTGGVRINRSMYRTQKEIDNYIDTSLKRPLP
jgi:hypothetical protein